MKIRNKAELKTLFHQDGKRALEGIARLFALMDQKKWNPGLANEVFQSIHSLKSEASFLGYTKVVSDAERMEEQLVQFRRALPTENEWKDFRNRYLTLEADLGTILRGVEMELSSSYDSQMSHLKDFEKVLLKEAKLRGEALFRIDAEVEDGEPMPYPRLYLLINTLELRTNVLGITPSLETLQKGKASSCSLLITSSSSFEQLQEWTQINGLKKVVIHPLQIEDFIGEEEFSSESRLRSPLFRYRKATLRNLTLSSHFFEVQELLISCMEDVKSFYKQVLLKGILQQAGVSVDLLMKKASQLVKDLAPQLGKEVTFHGVIHGEMGNGNIQIPYRVFEVLNTVMNHLIRNALDHGIEPPEEREKAGKSSYGNISLIMRQNGSIYSMQVQDDGKGIYRAAILSKSRDNGMNEKDLLSLLVQGGVSTKVSAVSGRGVGLQAVHTLVENLGGTLTLRTTPEKGTLFEVRFDLLSLKHPVFPCKQENKTFYVPKVLVEDIFPLSRTSIHVKGEESVYSMKGKEIPVQVLSMEPGAANGVGVLLSLWEHQGVLWTESVGDEQWIPPISLQQDMEVILSFLLSRKS